MIKTYYSLFMAVMSFVSIIFVDVEMGIYFYCLEFQMNLRLSRKRIFNICYER
mgnify:CR=1 FL=1